MAGSDTPLLTCAQVSRHFGSLAAVDGVSLQVMPGEVLGIGGPNGAGKTTFFDVVTGITAPSGGRIRFDGHDITTWGADRICHAGVARTFQLNAAFDHLTVQENVQVAAQFGRTARRFPGLWLSDTTKTAVQEALEFVGLGAKRQMIARDLPVLDRKLLMIAGAMATNPRMIFLDEPVGGLNTDEIDHIQALVRKMQARGITIVLIEHVMRFLLSLSSRVIIMHHGQVIFEGRPDQVAEDQTVVETYLGKGAAGRLKSHFSEADHV
ncbi:ABC transporter ATP-binding protein [Pseudooceanicola spongiae]|uniref:ATP-binding cassette domain-containing protein n=1 Tax=Pseudooceanicola spongiae TaxID=2613965 RepID=A0A7L9WN46_9RHOB|nr:ABC transporter ATP-binding protein [Pseudooceanicola spongiae]QOL80826.1 ATP-binding cassette domain-containing protein [Pseudooceanicola spongiae]